MSAANPGHWMEDVLIDNILSYFFNETLKQEPGSQPTRPPTENRFRNMDSPRSTHSEHSTYSAGTSGDGPYNYSSHMTPSPEYIAENVTIGSNGICTSVPSSYEQGYPLPPNHLLLGPGGYYHPHPGMPPHHISPAHSGGSLLSTPSPQHRYQIHSSHSPQSASSSPSSCHETHPSLLPKVETDHSSSSGDLPVPPPRKKHNYRDEPLQINEPSSTISGSAPVVRYCGICNDVASGFHYGVWSCEGCKAFFKRSIQGPVDYVCPATNNCNIDKQRRKSCQACRFRKCFEAGMVKGVGGNRRDRSQSRGRSSSQKRRQDPKDTSSTPKPKKLTESSNKSHSKDSIQFYEEFLNTLRRIEPKVVEVELPTGDNEKTLMGTLVTLGDKQLVHMINWVKQIPGFSKIALNDQVRLLELCWCELLILWLAYRSKPYENCLCYAPGIIFDKKRHEIAEMGEVGDQMIFIADHLRDIDITMEEFALIKVLVVANAETKFLESQKAIRELQMNASKVLQYHTAQTHPEQPDRYLRIMLLLPHIRQTSDRSIMRIFLFKSSDSGSTVDLLYEMLESHCIAKETEDTSQKLSQVKAHSLEHLDKIHRNNEGPYSDSEAT